MGVPVTVLYLGRRRSRHRGPGGRPVSEPRVDRTPGAVRECAFLMARALRHLTLLARGYAAAWRGHTVLCDRHPIEALATAPRRTPSGARLERLIARWLVPWPDAVIVLDAPAELLFERKREHPVAVLERWRRAYRDVFEPADAQLIATDGPAEDSVARVRAAIGAARRARAAPRARDSAPRAGRRCVLSRRRPPSACR